MDFGYLSPGFQRTGALVLDIDIHGILQWAPALWLFLVNLLALQCADSYFAFFQPWHCRWYSKPLLCIWMTFTMEQISTYFMILFLGFSFVFSLSHCLFWGLRIKSRVLSFDICFNTSILLLTEQLPSISLQEMSSIYLCIISSILNNKTYSAIYDTWKHFATKTWVYNTFLTYTRLKVSSSVLQKQKSKQAKQKP